MGNHLVFTSIKLAHYYIILLGRMGTEHTVSKIIFVFPHFEYNVWETINYASFFCLLLINTSCLLRFMDKIWGIL